MYESKLLAMIQEGENERIEFKRELNLDTAMGKAEFVKDIISLANSAPECGYLLVGVNDTKQVVGIDKLEEERIQQIASVYIDPVVVVRCSTISMQTSGSLLVGVIEIRGKNRPHKVSRPIEKLNQNEVFVRHGSVVARANPKEIISLDHASRLDVERKQFIRSAEAHAHIDELQGAIDAYSKAIEITPTSDILLARGKLYARLWQTQSDLDPKDRIADLAYKDLSGVIKLADSFEQEKEARFERLRIACQKVIVPWKEDFDWLKTHTQGRELGEVLFLDVQGLFNGWGFSSEVTEISKQLSQSIQLGFSEPSVFYLRAYSYFNTCNFGFALQDIDLALSKTEQFPNPEYFELRGRILLNVARFDEAYDSFSRARQLSKRGYQVPTGLILSDVEVGLLYLYAITYEFNGFQYYNTFAKI